MLAAAPNVTVAVVEAGSFYEFDTGNASQVPGYGANYLDFGALAKDYQLTDWDLITANQSVRLSCCRSPSRQKSNTKFTQGFNDRQIHYTAGKTLGGR